MLGISPKLVQFSYPKKDNELLRAAEGQGTESNLEFAIALRKWPKIEKQD